MCFEVTTFRHEISGFTGFPSPIPFRERFKVSMCVEPELRKPIWGLETIISGFSSLPSNFKGPRRRSERRVLQKGFLVISRVGFEQITSEDEPRKRTSLNSVLRREIKGPRSSLIQRSDLCIIHNKVCIDGCSLTLTTVK